LAQVTLSFGVASLIAVGMMQIVQGWLSVQFAKMVIQKPYIDHILVSDLTLLPLSIWDYALVAVITLLVSYLMVTLMFRHTVPGRQVEPAGLFKL
jgi:uncharacterized protein YqfA (UPF0365 family)